MIRSHRMVCDSAQCFFLLFAVVYNFCITVSLASELYPEVTIEASPQARRKKCVMCRVPVLILVDFLVFSMISPSLSVISRRQPPWTVECLSYAEGFRKVVHFCVEVEPPSLPCLHRLDVTASEIALREV